jgi:hypothetical protein
LAVQSGAGSKCDATCDALVDRASLGRRNPPYSLARSAHARRSGPSHRLLRYGRQP